MKPEDKRLKLHGNKLKHKENKPVLREKRIKFSSRLKR
jgi:hypothetical protein